MSLGGTAPGPGAVVLALYAVCGLLLAGRGARAQSKDMLEPKEAVTPNEKFIEAARHGRFDEVRALWDTGKVDVNFYSDDGGSGYAAIHWTALNANHEMCKLLLSYGADLDVKHKSGNTALHYAALDAHPEVARVLIDAGADLDAVNNADFTPSDAAMDTIEGRFRGPDPEDAQAVHDMIAEAKQKITAAAAAAAAAADDGAAPKKRRRRKKKEGEAEDGESKEEL